jgi:hypothetical protein
VLKNNNSEKYKWHLLITSYTTKSFQTAILFFVFYNNMPEEENTTADIVLYAIICLGLLNCVSTIFLHFLGNYFNLYRASIVCKLFCVSPIVHKSLIFEYLESPSYFAKDKEEDSFPQFFKIFSKEKNRLSLPGKHFEYTCVPYALLLCSSKKSQNYKLHCKTQRGREGVTGVECSTLKNTSL